MTEHHDLSWGFKKVDRGSKQTNTQLLAALAHVRGEGIPIQQRGVPTASNQLVATCSKATSSKSSRWNEQSCDCNECHPALEQSSKRCSRSKYDLLLLVGISKQYIATWCYMSAFTSSTILGKNLWQNMAQIPHSRISAMKWCYRLWWTPGVGGSPSVALVAIIRSNYWDAIGPGMAGRKAMVVSRCTSCPLVMAIGWWWCLMLLLTDGDMMVSGKSCSWSSINS